jgi:hypothetical protein
MRVLGLIADLPHTKDGGHDEKPTIGDDVASAFTQMINQTVTSKGMTPDL